MEPILTGVIAQAANAGATAADAAAKESGNLLVRLLGPSADVMGKHWADQLRERNLQRLIRKTEARAAAKELSGEPAGYANPRVASKVFESAQFAESEVVAEYLSGVLSSSRSETGQNDAGVAWTSLISRLSSDQLKLHYLFYVSIRPQVISEAFNKANLAHNLECVLPLAEVFMAMSISETEHFADAVDGLMREGLIGDGYSYGPKDYIFANEMALPGTAITFPYPNGIRLRVTIHGMRLFIWGMGVGALGLESYLNPSLALLATDSSTNTPLDTLPGFIVKNVVKPSEAGAQ